MDISTSLIHFARSIPEELPFAPIIEGKKPDFDYCPDNESFYKLPNFEDTLNRDPERYQALGLWCGPRTRLVCLDVDANLAALEEEHGSTLVGAPRVTSTKLNAAKYLFRVPEELSGEVTGLSLALTGKGYEVIYGERKQVVVFGIYPGNEHAQAPEGEYAFEGDLNSIPEAPGWLLEQMFEAGQQKQAGGVFKGHIGPYAGRTEFERRNVVEQCLSVLDPGMDQPQWFRVACAVKDAQLPDGLQIFEAWSKQSEVYAADWQREPDKGAKLFERIQPNKGVTLGTLVKMADEVDPKRERFDEETRAAVSSTENKEATDGLLSYDSLLTKWSNTLEIRNPGERKYVQARLATEAGFRNLAELEAIMKNSLEYRTADSCNFKELAEKDLDPSYVIPGILPSPYTVIIYGLGGTGKSHMTLAIAKYIVENRAMTVLSKKVPIQPGKVLYFTSDQNESLLQKAAKEVELESTAVRKIANYQMSYWFDIIAEINADKPVLCVWDSLTSHNTLNIYSENQKEYTNDLAWLAHSNGQAYHPTTHLILHHSRKVQDITSPMQTYRGSTSIENVVDEVWQYRRPTQDEIAANAGNGDFRVLTVEKSRQDMTGTKLYVQRHPDSTLTITDSRDIEKIKRQRTPTGTRAYVLDILRSRRISNPIETSRSELSVNEIVDALSFTEVGNSKSLKSSVRKALYALVSSGIVEITRTTKDPHKQGSPETYYRAVLADEEIRDNDVIIAD